MMFCCSNSDLFSEWRKIVSNHIELTMQNVDYFGTEFRVIFKNEILHHLALTQYKLSLVLWQNSTRKLQIVPFDLVYDFTSVTKMS